MQLRKKVKYLEPHCFLVESHQSRRSSCPHSIRTKDRLAYLGPELGVGMTRRSVLSSMDRFIAKRHWGEIVAINLLLIGAIGAFDYELGRDYTLGPIYAIPVVIGTWYAGRDVGLTLALAGTSLSFLAYHPQVLSASATRTLALNSILLLVLFLLIVTLTTRARNKMLLEEQLARMDDLTGSLNVRAFKEELDYHLALAAREGLPLTVAYVDVDDFKQVNDRFGHAGGDRVLRSIAATLKEFSRRTDRVTRIGGDEFAILMPDTDAAGAERIIREARRAFSQAFKPGVSQVTCSIGVITFIGRIPSADDAISTADALMYEVKRSGKGKVLYQTRHLE